MGELVVVTMQYSIFVDVKQITQIILIKYSTHRVECLSHHQQNQCLSNPIQRSCQIPKYKLRNFSLSNALIPDQMQIALQSFLKCL